MLPKLSSGHSDTEGAGNSLIFINSAGKCAASSEGGMPHAIAPAAWDSTHPLSPSARWHSCSLLRWGHFRGQGKLKGKARDRRDHCPELRDYTQDSAFSQSTSYMFKNCYKVMNMYVCMFMLTDRGGFNPVSTSCPFSVT